MIPVFREDQTVRVVAPSDTGDPKTVYVVSIYDVEREVATLGRLQKRRASMVAQGVPEGSQALIDEGQVILRDALTDVTRAIENEQGPDGQPRTITERKDIAEHYRGLPVDWLQEVAAEIRKPAAVSAELGKG